MTRSSQLRLWSLPLLLTALLLLASPTVAQDDNNNGNGGQVEPDFGFYPPNAHSCLYEFSNSTNCDRPNYDVLNECLCSNTRNFVTNSARCLGEQGADNLDEIYNDFTEACNNSNTPTNVERPEFMRAAENGASATTTTDGPSSTATDGPTTTSNAPLDTNPPSDENNDSSSGLGTGAYVGIGVGAAVAGALAMGAFGFWWFRRYRRRHAAETSPMLPHGDDEAAHGTPMYSASSPGFTESKTPQPPNTVSPATFSGAWGTPEQQQQAYGGHLAPVELPPGDGRGQAMEMEGSTHFNQPPVEMPGSTPGFTAERR